MRTGPVQVTPGDILPRAAVLYRHGLSMPAIARRFDCSATTVSRALKQAGVVSIKERGAAAWGLGGGSGRRIAAKAGLGDED